MAVDVEWYILPTLLSAIAMAGMGVFVLGLGFSRTLHRRLATLLVIKAMFFGVLFFGMSVDEFGDRVRGYFAIALPFSALWFAQAFMAWLNDRPPRWAAPGWLLALLVIAAEAVYVLRRETGGYLLVEFGVAANYVAAALLAWMFARAARRHGEGMRGRGLYLAALGFALEPLYMGAFIFFGDIFGLTYETARQLAYWRDEPSSLIFTGMMWASMAIAAGIMVSWGWGRRAVAGPAGRGMRIGFFTVSAMGVASSAALFVVPVAAFWDGVMPWGIHWFHIHWMFHSLTVLAALTMIGYGVLRFHFLDLDTTMRSTVQHGVLAAIAVFTFSVLSEALENVLANAASLVRAELAGALGAIPIAVALTYLLQPVRRMAERVAAAVVPSHLPWADLPLPRRLSLFQEQAELAYFDGALEPKEEAMLVSLRERLALRPKQTAPIVAAAAKRVQAG